MRGDEGGSFSCALGGIFVAAFPFENGPRAVPRGSEASKDLLEVHLSVTEATEAAWAFLPAEVSAVYAGASGRPELSVLHVEGLDIGTIEIDEAHVVHALQ